MINKKLIFTLSLLLISGCFPDINTPTYPLSDIDEGVAAYNYITEAWMQAGYSLGRRDKCDISHLSVTFQDADQFYKFTGFYDSYSIPNCQATYGYSCAIAVNQPVSLRDSVIAIAIENPAEFLPRIYFHEVLHFIIECSAEDRKGDPYHENEKWWGQDLHSNSIFMNAIRNCIADRDAGENVICPPL